MPYNHLRANIRNAMVGMTVSESQDFADSFVDTSFRDSACVESKGYAKEFLRELEEESAACDMTDLF